MSGISKKTMALAAVIGGIVILCVKLAAYLISGSVALLSDALESIINVIASCVMLYAVRLAANPADKTHNYGHEKVENISSLIEGVLIIGAAVVIIEKSMGRFFHPVALKHLEMALGFSFFATVLNAGLSWGLMRVSRAEGSIALEGDAKHLLSDVISSLAVVAGLLLARLTGWYSLDPILAIGVSLVLAKMGVQLVLKSSYGLMDQSCPDEERKIVEILRQHHKQFVDFHDIRTRRSGNRVFAELHLSMRGKMTVEQSHHFTEHIEEDVFRAMPNVSVTIHVEPPERKRR
jgi:cation diffusion facilitator family transporter